MKRTRETAAIEPKTDSCNDNVRRARAVPMVRFGRLVQTGRGELHCKLTS